MKTTISNALFVTVLSLTFAMVGCKTKERGPTPLPGEGIGRPPGGGRVGNGNGNELPGGGVVPIGPGSGGVDTGGPNGGLPRTDLTGRIQDREMFQNETAYFDFDLSSVKASQVSKVEAVAAKFKTLGAGNDLLIEGHCDERGTEEYNRALGEKRALALRDFLIRAGISADRVHTKSFGKDKPASVGHDDAAWSKNRRGEFILVLPR